MGRLSTLVFLLTFIPAVLGSGATADRDVIMDSKRLIEVDKNYDQALENLKKEVQRTPRSAEAWYWLGVAHSKKQQNPDVIQCINRAFNLNLHDTYHLEAYTHLAWAYFYTSDFSQAIENSNKALKIQLNYLPVLFVRGLSYSHSWRLAEAIQDFSQILAKVPTNAFALESRGSTYKNLGEIERALTDFDAAITHAGSQDVMVLGRALRGRGWCRYFKGEFEQAAGDFDRALTHIRPDEKNDLRDAYRGKAFTSLSLGRDKEALSWIEKAKSASAYDASYDISLIYYAMGNKGKALEYWGRAGYIGATLQDYKKGRLQGAEIVILTKDGPADQAGLMAEDIIWAVNRQPITNEISLRNIVSKLPPGGTVKIYILRKGVKMIRDFKVGSPESAMENDLHIKPILASRKGQRAITTSTAETDPQKKKASFPDSKGDKTKVQKPSLQIEKANVTPKEVIAGSSFEVAIEFIAKDPSKSEGELPLIVERTISRDGKVLANFEPQKNMIPNGKPWTIILKTRAAKAEGKYSMSIRLKYKEHVAEEVVHFIIK